MQCASPRVFGLVVTNGCGAYSASAKTIPRRSKTKMREFQRRVEREPPKRAISSNSHREKDGCRLVLGSLGSLDRPHSPTKPPPRTQTKAGRRRELVNRVG